MSFHFLNGITYFQYVDTGPGTIIVDPLARIVPSNVTLDALTLGGGSWDITISGLVYSNLRGIFLADSGAPISNIKIKAGGEVFGSQYSIQANHAANITNAGAISAKNNSIGIWENGDGDFFINNLKTGLIEGGGSAIRITGLGTHTIANAGTIAVYGGLGAIVCDDGVEKVTNWGKIEGNASSGGGVFLGAGNDVLTNFKKVHGVIKHGTVTGVIDLGEGDDIFNGGKRAETLRDRDGTDTYKFGGGNDTYLAVYTSSSPSGDGIDLANADIVNGGAGIDTYDASALVNNGFITVNLDSVAHSGGVVPNSVRVSAGGVAIGIDTVSGIEKFIGTDGFDVFWGSSGADIFEGGAAGDTIIGLRGADNLTGGDGNDSFLYTSLKDSGPTKATRDFIADFGFGGDQIDLQSLDINDDFHFVGNNVAFDGTPGAIIAVDGADERTVVKLDVNGDKVADFSIGFSELLTFAVSDFQL